MWQSSNPKPLQIEGILLFFHVFSTTYLTWLSTDTRVTITEGNTESWFITEDDPVLLINRLILTISSSYWKLSFLFKYWYWLWNRYPVIISELMEAPECCGSRISYTSIIPGFGKFITIEKSVRNKDPIQLKFISCCCFVF